MQGGRFGTPIRMTARASSSPGRAPEVDALDEPPAADGEQQRARRRGGRRAVGREQLVRLLVLVLREDVLERLEVADDVRVAPAMQALLLQ